LCLTAQHGKYTKGDPVIQVSCALLIKEGLFL
jgi:hypothetical protein